MKDRRSEWVRHLTGSEFLTGEHDVEGVGTPSVPPPSIPVMSKRVKQAYALLARS
jgi:hypothetical protein